MTAAALPDRFDSDRLAMRPQAIADAPALHTAYRDPDLMRYWSSAPHATIAETVAYLTPRADHADWRGWSIMLKGDDTEIGTLGASQRRPGVYEIGYLLARPHWGRGIAREAVTRLIDLLVDDGGARRVWADTDPDNAPSNRLLKRLGFRREGHLRAEWETHIGVRDSYIWGLLRHEWRR